MRCPSKATANRPGIVAKPKTYAPTKTPVVEPRLANASSAINDSPQGKKPLIQPISKLLNNEGDRAKPAIVPHSALPCHQRAALAGRRTSARYAVPMAIITKPTIQPSTD